MTNKQTTDATILETLKAITESQAQIAAAMASLTVRIDKLEKPEPAPKKQAGTKVQNTNKISEENAGKEIPMRTRKTAPKKTGNGKTENGLKVVNKFGTQKYLRVPRTEGNAEVAHINLQTKRGHCVATIHKKAEKSDMGLIREFLLAYANQLTYTKKLIGAGISNALELKKATDSQLMQAFGC